jgi:hypothetical protein
VIWALVNLGLIWRRIIAAPAIWGEAQLVPTPVST